MFVLTYMFRSSEGEVEVSGDEVVVLGTTRSSRQVRASAFYMEALRNKQKMAIWESQQKEKAAQMRVARTAAVVQIDKPSRANVSEETLAQPLKPSVEYIKGQPLVTGITQPERKNPVLSLRGMAAAAMAAKEAIRLGQVPYR